jgi:succinate dehydrogenase / fumarate reductase flavoprotein subunit
LKNNKGERFMFNYVPERFAAETADSEEEANRWLAGDKEARRPPELLTRDVVARAIRAEVQAGRGSPHGGAFLDIASRVPAEAIKKKLPSMYHQFKELAEVDITKEAMEVGPTLHYFMGGIRVDHDTQQTRVPGLFACGECSAGMHGGNRLGGNSLSDLLVFGRLAGVGAGEYLKANEGEAKVDEEQISTIVRTATDVLNRESGPNPFIVHEKLQDIMQDNVGIVRTAEDLEKGIGQLESLKEEIAAVKAEGASQYNAGWHEALDLPCLMISSEAVARAALMREESRGAHTRLDFEGERDEEWGNLNVVVRKGADGMEVEKVQKPAPPEGLEEIARATLEDLEAK